MTRPSRQCLGRTHPQNRTLCRFHTRHKEATQNTPHQQEERGPVRVQKGLRTDSQGEVSKAGEDQRRGTTGMGKGTNVNLSILLCPSQRVRRSAPEFMFVTEEVSQLEMCPYGFPGSLLSDHPSAADWMLPFHKSFGPRSMSQENIKMSA